MGRPKTCEAAKPHSELNRSLRRIANRWACRVRAPKLADGFSRTEAADSYGVVMTEDCMARAARWLMDDIEAAALVEEAAQPHCVIAFDPSGESYTVTGPYPDAHVATLEADRIRAELNSAAGHPDYPPFQTWIALHFPPKGQ